MSETEKRRKCAQLTYFFRSLIVRAICVDHVDGRITPSPTPGPLRSEVIYILARSFLKNACSSSIGMVPWCNFAGCIVFNCNLDNNELFKKARRWGDHHVLLGHLHVRWKPLYLGSWGVLENVESLRAPFIREKMAVRGFVYCELHSSIHFLSAGGLIHMNVETSVSTAIRPTEEMEIPWAYSIQRCRVDLRAVKTKNSKRPVIEERLKS